MGVRGIARILAPRRRGVLYVERLRIEPRRRLAAAATGTRSVAVILGRAASVRLAARRA
jgi:hypothetical protein